MVPPLPLLHVLGLLWCRTVASSVGRDESKLTVLNIAEAEFMKLVHK